MHFSHQRKRGDDGDGIENGIEVMVYEDIETVIKRILCRIGAELWRFIPTDYFVFPYL